MITNNFFERLFLELPATLSDDEMVALVEKARYEAFKKDAAAARTTVFDIAVTVTTLSLAIVCSSLVLFSGSVGESPVLRALVVAFFLAIAFCLSSLLKSYNRAKVLNPILRELLNEQT